MSKLILFEGLDLVGKSTLCRNIVNSDLKSFIYRKGLYSSENALYRETVAKSKQGVYSEETIAWMYIAAAKHELDLLRQGQCFSEDKIIIQDSFFVNRMMGVHSVTNRKLLLEEIKEILKEFETPQLAFYIYSDLPVRRERFEERKAFKKPAFGDKLVFEDESLAKQRENNYQQFITSTYDATVIDNTKANIEELSQKTLMKIKENL